MVMDIEMCSPSEWLGRIYEPTGEIKDKGKSWPGKEIFKIFKDLAKGKSNYPALVC